MRLRCALVSLGLVLCGLVPVALADLASAYWSSSSAVNGRGAAAATSVNAGARPSGTASGQGVSVGWAASTLGSGQAVSGYVVSRRDAQTLAPDVVRSGCSGTVTTTSCTESGVPDGSWVYAVTPLVGTSWRGPESPMSTAVRVDVTAPSSSLALSSVTGSATLTGTTVYYQGAAAGSLRLTNTVTDAGSGPASSSTAALGGTTTGWSHSPSTVSTPAGGPYVSATFSWTAGTTSAPTETVTSTDASGNTTTTTLTFVSDSSAPSGTISYADGFSPGRSVAVSYTTTSNGADVATAQLQRSRASLKAGVCGTFSAFGSIGPATPASPYTDGPGIAGACYQYRLLVTDTVNNTGIVTSTAVARLGYAGAVRATPGVLSYWRFGEAAATSTDSFTGTPGVALQDRDGETGATWTRHSSSAADAVLTATGRARKEGSTTTAVFYGSGTPAGAAYRVSADVYAATVVAGDRAGVVGRLDPAASTYYLAAYSNAAAAWTLSSVVSGTATVIGSAAQSFPAGTTRRVGLDLNGTTVRVLVDGAAVISVTDGAITAAGRGGVLLGGTTATDLGDGAGLQLDNYVLGPVDEVPVSADSVGANPGAYVNGPVLGQPGVLAGDLDTAARFDGVDDYMQVAAPTGLPTGAAARSVELWFKTTASSRQVLYGYGTASSTAEFALWLNPGGASMTAWGYGSGHDKTFTLATAATDGSWHQVVTTYDGTTLILYVDGVTVGSQAATRSTVVDAHGLGIGAVVTPGDPSSGGFFAGVIDEIAVYTSALAADVVADHYGLASPYQDVDGPTGGSVDGANLLGLGNRYRSTTSLSLALAKGSDASGLAASGAQLQRATAVLGTNTCQAFGTYAAVASDPATPRAETVANGSCYRYRYVVPDVLGNTTTYASPSIKVDTTVPATPGTPAYSALSSTYGTGTTVYYRSTAPSGAITLTASSSDTGSGIAGFTFPALGTGWSTALGATTATTAAATYSWSATGPAAPGSRSITATNNATLVSAARAIAFVDDTSVPTGGAISYTNGRVQTTTTSLALTIGSDTGSGVGTTKSVQASTAPASGGVCGTFGAFAQVAAVTTATSYTATLALDTCYRFQYVVPDRVGNSTTYTSTSVVRRAAVYSTTVTGTSGASDYWRLGEAAGATSAVDAVGATNNGTYQGAPTLGVTGVLNGDTNTAATFDGTSQYVSMNRGLATSFSIELWLRSTQTTGGTGAQWSTGASLVDADATGVANDFGIALQSDGRVLAGVGTSGGSEVSVASAAGYNDGQWHQVVFTRTQSTGALVLYVDGAQVSTATGGTASLSASATMTLARSALGTRFYAGSLDEVATYTSVLTAAQVTARWNAAR